MKTIRLISSIFILLVISCTPNSSFEYSLSTDSSEQPDDSFDPNASYNILFVGNSLTYYNNLPGLVKEEAATRGIIINTRMLASSNYAIVDHWAEGEVQTLISSGIYDFVVIQQGPSSLEFGFNMLVNSGADYANLCQANNTRLAYYMVWPALVYYHTFDNVIANYTAAAEANNAILCPVGRRWKEHFDQTNDFSYYDPDGFHPSFEGSRFAAEVIVQSLNLQ
ncbi:SGNH/GDSL hydrolase family protein [uncultured Psychroserpens sp.]|uniref:SGNH/GDSL hydrolase family protein n=1 Tax=uncultured Psychroserpens sp. TaxID=255436 RepID=UPI0026031995|nr:SGNH/GDSL hydrolase family protein [uncultured Psychroserpens sp.]